MLNIFTLTFNGKHHLENLYPSIFPALKNISYKFFIKDNGSIDNSIGYLESLENKNIIIHATEHNKDNFSEGNNLLYDIAKPCDNDYILLLNNDIVLKDTTSIRNMIDILDKDKNVGIVGAKLNYVDKPTTIQHTGVVYPKNYGGYPFHYRSKQIETEQDRLNRIFQSVTGAVLLTRASVVKEVIAKTGYMLQPDYKWAFDDIDFCLNVRSLGYSIVNCGKTNILHSESASLKINPFNHLFFNHNKRVFQDKWVRTKFVQSDLYLYESDKNYNLYKSPK